MRLRACAKSGLCVAFVAVAASACGNGGSSSSPAPTGGIGPDDDIGPWWTGAAESSLIHLDGHGQIWGSDGIGRVVVDNGLDVVESGDNWELRAGDVTVVPGDIADNPQALTSVEGVSCSISVDGSTMTLDGLGRVLGEEGLSRGRRTYTFTGFALETRWQEVMEADSPGVSPDESATFCAGEPNGRFQNWRTISIADDFERTLIRNLNQRIVDRRGTQKGASFLTEQLTEVCCGRGVAFFEIHGYQGWIKDVEYDDARQRWTGGWTECYGQTPDFLADPCSRQCNADNCAEVLCGDGEDNDGDGFADCLDPDCAGAMGPDGCRCGAEVCDDDCDNDGDEQLDCDDDDCADQSCGQDCVCGGPEDCTDNVDNNGDDVVDCAEESCNDQSCGEDCVCRAGERHEASCDDGIDGDGDGLTDCEDGPDCNDRACHSDGGVCRGGVCETGMVELTVVVQGSGSATITSDPAGIDCGGTCTAMFPADSMVTLTSTVDDGSVLVGWDGPCASADDQCSITLASEPVTINVEIGRRGVPQWGTPIRAGFKEIRGVEVAPNGDTVVMGWFQTSIDVGDETATVPDIDYAIFVARLDPSGNVLWLRRYGEMANPGNSTLTRMHLDDDGNIFISGYGQGNVTFGGPTSADDVFLTKLSTSGDHLETVFLPEQPWEFGINDDGDVVACFSANGPRDFGAFTYGPGILLVGFDGTTLANSWGTEIGPTTGAWLGCALDSQGDVFVASLMNGGGAVTRHGGNDGGLLRTASATGNIGGDFDIAADVGAAITGDFRNPGIDLGTGLVTAPGDDPVAAYVGRYHPDGAAAWVQGWPGVFEFALARFVDVAGSNIAVAGYFDDGITFPDETLSASGESPQFVRKLDVNGTTVHWTWVGPSAFAFPKGLALAPNGDVVVVIEGEGSTDLGGGVVVDLTGRGDAIVRLTN